MPSLGADMDAGTLVEWQVQPGGHVKRGDIVALVETAKGIIEVEIWETGVIDRLLVAPGSEVPVGTLLAVVRPEVSEPAPPPPPTPLPAPETAPAPAPKEAAAPGSLPPGAPWVRASPAARQLARELHVELAGVHGTGPHGVVTRDDVARTGHPMEPLERRAEPVERRAEPVEQPTRAAMRQAIAAAMTRSKREIPHYYLSTEIDVSRAAAWLEAENAGRAVGDRLILAALQLRCVARALTEVPELNGFFRDGAFHPSPAVHVGVAISLKDGGLVAPAIHDTDRRTLEEIMSALRDLVARARAGKLRASEMSDPTITVTNLGDLGTDAVFGVIYPPQVAIVGFGAARERAWAEGGMLGVRQVIVATLSADHRASDGHRGARFLSRVAELLSRPEET